MHGEKITFNIKTWIGIIAVAWSPAIYVGTSLMRWGSAMDHRVTVQEETVKHLSSNLEILNSQILRDLDLMRSDFRTYGERLIRVEQRVETLESK